MDTKYVTELSVLSVDKSGLLQIDSPVSTLMIADDRQVATNGAGGVSTVTGAARRAKKAGTISSMVRIDAQIAVARDDGAITKLPLSAHAVLTVPRVTHEQLPLQVVSKALQVLASDLSKTLDDPTEIQRAILAAN